MHSVFVKLLIPNSEKYIVYTSYKQLFPFFLLKIKTTPLKFTLISLYNHCSYNFSNNLLVIFSEITAKACFLSLLSVNFTNPKHESPNKQKVLIIFLK